MPTLSVIIITRNEERNLPRTLESVKFADEIIVYDSYSTDRTVEIALRFHARVEQAEFKGFGASKKAALLLAHSDWVLSLDADETLDEELQEAVREALKINEYVGYCVNRRSNFLGRWMRHSGWYPDYLLRMFRREAGRFSEARVHESVIVKGKVGRLRGHILHYTDPDLSHYLHKMDNYTTLAATELAEKGQRFRAYYLVVKPVAVFLKIYLLKRGFLDGIHGLLLAALSSVHVFMKYAKLWELSRR